MSDVALMVAIVVVVGVVLRRLLPRDGFVAPKAQAEQGAGG